MFRSAIIAIVTLISFSVFAGAGPHFTSATCKASGSSLTIELTHQNCLNEQYAEWNPQGCFHAKVMENGAVFFENEILRDFPHREERQGHYSILRYDEDEWIELGLLIELKSGLFGNKFRLDVRGASRDEMVVKARGRCKLN